MVDISDNIYRMVCDVLRSGRNDCEVPSYISRTWRGITLYATPQEARLEYMTSLVYALPPQLSHAVWSALDDMSR